MSGFSGKVGFNAGKLLGGSGSGQLVSLVKLPQNLAFNQKAIRLSGEISQVNQNNNTVRIETNQGQIEAKVPPKIVRTVNTGQAVVVEIPKGNSPKQIRLSLDITGGRPPGDPSPAVKTPEVTYQSPNIKTQGVQLPNQPSTPVPSQGNNPATNVSINNGAPPSPYSPTERTDQINLPIKNQQVTRQNSGQNTRPNVVTAKALEQFLGQIAKQTTNLPQPLNPDSNVRLLSVPPAQAQDIATQFLRSLPPAITVRPTTTSLIQTVPLPANASVQNTLLSAQPSAPPLITQGSNILQPVQNIGTFTPPPAPVITLNGATANLAVPAQTATLPPNLPSVTAVLTTTQTLTQQQSIPLLQTIQSGTAPANAPPPVNAAPTSPIQGQAASLQPILFDPAAPPSPLTQPTAIQSAPKIDINILNILPSTPQITPPSTNAPPSLAQAIPAATNFAPQLLTIPQAGALSGKVTGFTPQGLPLITTRFPGAALPQSFILQFNSNNLQLGSTIQFTAKQPVQTQSAATLAAQSTTNPLLRGFQWPAMDQLLQTMAQLNPQMASSLTRALPNAGNPAQLGTAAMMVIAAIRSGDFGMLLGDRKIDALQRAGRDNILSQLTQARAPAAAAPEAASGGDWRAVPLPMFWEGEIQRVTLYTRKEGDDSNQNTDDKKVGQTRFIFDLSLSRMGDVQLDGFLKDQRLDLIVRTQNAFSLPMQQTMRQSYAGALNSTDLTGELNFQGNTDHWVNVLEEKEQLGVHV